MNGESEASHGKFPPRGRPGKPNGGGRSQRSGSSDGRAGGDMRPRSAKGPPKRKLLPAQIRQAKMMVEQSGIPFPSAVRVVLGKTTLNDVLQELLREEKIKKLMETHGINRALATNIALGRTDLDIVLLRRRKNQTLQDHYTQSCLEEAIHKGHRVAMALHGHRKVMGTVQEVGKYVFAFLEDGQTTPTEIHKTQAKFAYDPDQYKQLRKFMGLDGSIKSRSLEPILRAKERHHFKNLALQQSIDNKTEVSVVTLEGDTFRGQVEWFGRWEFGLKFKGGVRVTVFRHAVFQLKPAT